MINGVNPATFFVLPMLGQHYSYFPRFRDCFIQAREWTVRDDGMPVMKDKENTPQEYAIHVFTRVGGGNRDGYVEEIEKLQGMEGYIEDFDDDFDSTYATFVFKVPEKWAKDFDKIRNGEYQKVSKKYQKVVLDTYPKLAEELEKVFNPPEDNNDKSTE